MLDSFMGGVKGAIEWVVNLLPGSPFRAVSNDGVSGFLSGLNWVIPIGTMVAELEVYVIAVLIFYVLSVVMRWVKVIK